jgi:hypothetical protein
VARVKETKTVEVPIFVHENATLAAMALHIPLRKFVERALVAALRKHQPKTTLFLEGKRNGK